MDSSNAHVLSDAESMHVFTQAMRCARDQGDLTAGRAIAIVQEWGLSIGLGTYNFVVVDEHKYLLAKIQYGL